MTLGKIENHIEAAQLKLPSKRRDKANTLAFLDVLVSPAQVFEDALWQLYTERRIDTAIGAQLDDIGEIVGQPRVSADDEVYRLYLRARIRVNRSSGTTEDILDIARLILNDPDAHLQNDNTGIAAYVLRVLGVELSDELAATLFKFLRDSTADGVRTVIEYLPDGPSESAFWDESTWASYGDVTVLTSGSDNTDGTSANTASVTPTVGRNQYIAIITAGSGQPTPTNGNGLTWSPVSITSFPISGPTHNLVLYQASGTPAGSAAIAITADDTATSWAWVVFEVDGLVSATPLQTKVGNAPAASTSVTATFDDPLNSPFSRSLAIVGSTTAVTPDADFTEHGEASATVPAAVCELQSANDESSCTATFASSAAAIILIELQCDGSGLFAGRVDENGVS